MPREFPKPADMIRRLRELFIYDNVGARFIRRVPVNNRWKAGLEAGGVGSGRTRHLRIDGKYYTEAQLVWLLHKGVWPTAPVSHRNGNPYDNTINNLILVDTPKNKTIEHDRLKTLISYDPDTGIFIWRVAPTSGRRKVGDRAGHIDHPMGYRVITIGGRTYKEHRLAWFYMKGEWPNGHIDHINNKHGDNRITNLRIATRSQNMANRKVSIASRTGIKGVARLPNGQFIARKNIDGKVVSLGKYDTAEEAHEAYMHKARELHGAFARSS